MKTPEFTGPKNEQSRNFRIEHLPWFDVVINLGYEEKEDTEEILQVMRREGENSVVSRSRAKVFSLRKITDVNDDPKFFVKYKKAATQTDVDFIVGRNETDRLNPSVKTFFDFQYEKKARYGLAGVLNEIILTKKIKELIAGPEFQGLAKKHGFNGLKFPEPIVAIVSRDKEKYIVYRRVKQKDPDSFDGSIFVKIIRDLRELFLKNGIIPNDLRSDQFFVTENNELVLTDIEAYTEK